MKTAEEFFAEKNGGKFPHESFSHDETFTAIYVVDFAKEFAAQSKNKHCGNRTFEEILEGYHVQLGDSRRDESIKLAAEEYANRPKWISVSERLP